MMTETETPKTPKYVMRPRRERRAMRKAMKLPWEPVPFYVGFYKQSPEPLHGQGQGRISCNVPLKTLPMMDHMPA